MNVVGGYGLTMSAPAAWRRSIVLQHMADKGGDSAWGAAIYILPSLCFKCRLPQSSRRFEKGRI